MGGPDGIESGQSDERVGNIYFILIFIRSTGFWTCNGWPKRKYRISKARRIKTDPKQTLKYFKRDLSQFICIEQYVVQIVIILIIAFVQSFIKTTDYFSMSYFFLTAAISLRMVNFNLYVGL